MAPRVGFARRWMAALASLQVGLVCTTTLLPAFHRAFADHDHIYCEQHHVFEDVPRQDPAKPADVPTGHRGLASRRGDGERKHIACSFSNLSLNSFEPVHAAASAVFSVVQTSARLLSASTFPQIPALVLAPKHSPPAFS